MSDSQLIELNVDMRGLGLVSEALEMLPDVAEKALFRTVQRVTQGIRTDIIGMVRERYDLRARDVRQDVHFKREVSASNMQVTLTATASAAIPLMRFGGGRGVDPRIPVPTRLPGGTYRKPAAVRVLKAGGRKTIEGAFVQRMPKSGHVGVFQRKPGDKKKIYELYGPSPLAAITNEEQFAALEASAWERFQKEWGRQAEWALEEAGK